MGKHLRLEDFKLKPRIPTSIPLAKHKHTYYCEQCKRYHYIYSNIGNAHRDYRVKEIKEVRDETTDA